MYLAGPELSELAYAVEASCAMLNVPKFADAYSEAHILKRGSSKGFWAYPPFLPKGCEVFAPNVHRLRLVNDGATDRPGLIAKFHADASSAHREAENAARLASALKGHVQHQGDYAVSLDVVQGEVIEDATGAGWLVLPIVEHACTVEWALRTGRELPHRAAVHAVAALMRSLEQADVFWRGMAPRNLLIRVSGTVISLVLCDFERGLADGLLPRWLGRLEEISFCLEEFVNMLTDDDLRTVFSGSLRDLREPRALTTEIPLSAVDSRRQQVLLQTIEPSASACGRLPLGKLEAVRETLRHWQRIEEFGGYTIDPIPLLDCVTAGLSTDARLEITRVVGECDGGDARWRLMKRLRSASELLTVLDLVHDATERGQTANLAVPFNGLRHRLLEWVVHAPDAPPPGIELLESQQVKTQWVIRLLAGSWA